MRPESVPRLQPGVRLRAGGAEAMLLVPEGVVRLSPTAAAIIEAMDGSRTVAAITALMAERFDTGGAEPADDVAELLRNFADHAWIALDS